ncbi:uncharacterized protein C16orf90 homolog [Choloepus didactylus]|uniref:uncharacterized protein C16orf90 homolog n=1 Tax=Choloepus didactylus TaxID=27675 RepID=UPI0018A0ADD8|nr:uncharacterized protein C16orf90 homolog [Choloepus didactylus]
MPNSRVTRACAEGTTSRWRSRALWAAGVGPRCCEGLRAQLGLHDKTEISPGPERTTDGSYSDAVSWVRGHPSHPETPPNIYEGGLGAQQLQCPSAPGSKPKNFRLRHLRALALYLPAHMQPTGQAESHWLGRLMAGGCLPWPGGLARALDPPRGTLGPGTHHCPALLEAQLPRGSLGSPASSSSPDPARRAPTQLGPLKGLGLRPKRSWGALEESTCPLAKRTRAGALETP